MPTETGLTRNQIISELTRSPHGNLGEYLAIGREAARTEADFFAHLIAWNEIKGQIRDSRVALPIIALSANPEPEYRENALAHLGLLDARNLLRAVRFSRETKLPAHQWKGVKRLVRMYLRAREAKWGWWEHTAVQHRATMKELYVRANMKPAPLAEQILFQRDYPAGSIFETIARLKDLDPQEAAGQIITRKIPFLIAHGALGPKAKNPDLVMAMIQRMSPTELSTNAKFLEKLGVRSVPALRAAFEEALDKASKSKRNVLKTSKAAAAVGDEVLREKLKGLQEKQLDKLGGVEGNWLVLADESGSMSMAIERAKEIAALLSRSAKGTVWLVFFSTAPTGFEVTGKTLDEIRAMTRGIHAGGGTSIGCGLKWAMDRKFDADGIVVVSDGGENNPPFFHQVYPAYSKAFDREVPVYFYRLSGDRDGFSERMREAGLDLQVFDLTGGVDAYSLPNLVATMRVSRYSLSDEIMATRLLTLADVFAGKEK